MALLRQGANGADVIALQQMLLQAGCDPQGEDGDFSADTDAAVRRFQSIHDLTIDGAVQWPIGETADALHLFSGAPPPAATVATPAAVVALHDVTLLITPLMVARMFPQTPLVNIGKNLPFVLGALSKAGLGDRAMVLMALGTIRAETASFEPIAEGVSEYNTSGNSHNFDLYDGRKDLGNGPSPDGTSFRGRGYVQLTGRSNYTFYGQVIGQPLATQPQLACDATVAGEILAAFLKRNEIRIRAALAENDLGMARKLVNGGEHGIADFTDAFERGLKALPA